MPTERECRCCKECAKVVEKMKIYNKNFDGNVECITVHPGFEGACLNIWALETAYKQYRQQYGNLEGPLNEYVFSFLHTNKKYIIREGNVMHMVVLKM